jgi:hypothetical protein
MAKTKLENVTGLGFDPNFAQLDTRGLPGIEEQREESFVDERFGGLVNESRFSLRQALTDMAEKDGSDPEVARVLAEAGIENPSQATTVYIAEQPFSIVYHEGLWRGEGVLDHRRRRLTAKSRDELVGKLMALARRTKKEAIHELSEGEKLQVVRIAQGGDIRGAIAHYLRLAIGEERADQYENPTDMLGDPGLSVVFDEAAALTWFASRPRVQDSEEFQDFLQDYRGGRPFNHDLLDGAWATFNEKRNRLIFAPMPDAQEATEEPEQLDDLSDTDVEKLMASTKREYVKTALAGRR